MEKKTRHVVVVDDEVRIAKTVALGLRTAGYGTSVAFSGDELLEVLANRQNAGEPVDLVLMDLHMPGMSASEVCTQLAQSEPRIPVLIMTGVADGPGRAQLAEYGCSEVLSKPFSKVELLARIVSMIGEAR